VRASQIEDHLPGWTRNLVLAPNWRLEAAITGTLGSVPLHRGGGHLACQSARLPAA